MAKDNADQPLLIEPAALLKAALAHTARGWQVFPLQDCGTPTAKQPRTNHGYKDATADAATVTS